MKKLHLTFWNQDGSKKTFVIHQVDQNLTPEKVYYLMNKLIELKLFVKNGIQLCTKIHSAKYVEVITTPLFNVSKEPEQEAILEELVNQKFAEIATEKAVQQTNTLTITKKYYPLIEQIKFYQSIVFQWLVLEITAFYQTCEQLFYQKNSHWQRGPDI
ncbi:hypothetical protein M2139_000282 [Enterococcus sp. PF1-24]|uniref:DUF2922 domain-containing protein n=1 Tax=unclassified Enterococcus TaxID=2608891 RepID=UPI0024763B6B|nr:MULTISPECIES: DUF2922 domain-containing protein [unclassified Enterococcus]MDH6363298.1 hypothetical protein [Enterococcus sp. PFB1-1]MDH6400401.1 hypothetical protein [Enterococcus sp. PF1-24]